MVPFHGGGGIFSGNGTDINLTRDWVAVVPPTEDTFVGTCQRWCHLHALVALNAIKCVLVAAPSAAKHGFGPPEGAMCSMY